MKKFVIFLFLMFSLQLVTTAKESGYGIEIYKIYNTNLKMPLLITNVEAASPADTLGLKADNLILKINTKETNTMTLEECLSILNRNKEVKLEVSEFDFSNKQTLTIKNKKGFSTQKADLKIPLKNLSKNRIYPILKHENSLENLLSQYFYTRNPDYKWSNLTNKEIDNEDIKKIQKPYQAYLNNKNNMEFNKKLYDGINTFIKQYKEINEWEINDLKNILVSYDKISDTASEEEVINDVKKLNITNSEYFINNAINRRKERIKTWTTMAKDIKDYSVAYETKRKKTTSKITTPYFIDNVDFREILWGWQMQKQPQKNGIYVISSGTGAKVFQSVNGGILVTADFPSISYNPRIIYITTKRQYADGDYIKGNVFIVFEGYYSYYNALGSMNKIYKFKEVPQAEYWNRVQKKEYYFIK